MTDTAPTGTDADDPRSTGQLIAQATQDIGEIVRGEVALAKAELKVDVINAGLGGGLLVGAAYLLSLMLVMLCVAAGFGLIALGIWTWAAFLIVAGICLALAITLALAAKARLQKVSPPTRTIDSAKQSLAAVKGSATQ